MKERAIKTPREWFVVADEMCGHGKRKRECERCLTALFTECQRQILQATADLVDWIQRRNPSMGAAARTFVEHGKIGVLKARKRQERIDQPFRCRGGCGRRTANLTGTCIECQSKSTEPR